MNKIINSIGMSDKVLVLTLTAILSACLIVVFSLGEMDLALLSMSRDLIYVSIAIVVLRLYFYLMNKMVGFDFKKWVANSDSLSVAILLSSMFIGTSMLMASILG